MWFLWQTGNTIYGVKRRRVVTLQFRGLGREGENRIYCQWRATNKNGQINRDAESLVPLNVADERTIRGADVVQTTSERRREKPRHIDMRRRRRRLLPNLDLRRSTHSIRAYITLPIQQSGAKNPIVDHCEWKRFKNDLQGSVVTVFVFGRIFNDCYQLTAESPGKRIL